MREYPNYHQLLDIELEYDRRGDPEGKRDYLEKLYADLRLQYLTSPSLETAENQHMRQFLEARLLKKHYISERSAYTKRQIEYICKAAELMKSGEDGDGATTFYRRVGRMVKPPVGFSRVSQVFGAKGNGGLGWKTRESTWDEFRETVLIVASQIGCHRT